jgi:hypothetical protein
VELCLEHRGLHDREPLVACRLGSHQALEFMQENVGKVVREARRLALQLH